MRLPWAPSPSSPSCFPAQGAVGGGGGGGTTPLPFLRRICRIHWGANPCLVPFLCLLILGRRDVLLERRVWEVVLLGVLRARPRHGEFGAPARLCGVKPRERLHDHPRSHSGAPVPVGVSTSRVPGQFAFFRRPKPRRDLPIQASSAYFSKTLAMLATSRLCTSANLVKERIRVLGRKNAACTTP